MVAMKTNMYLVRVHEVSSNLKLRSGTLKLFRKSDSQRQQAEYFQHRSLLTNKI